MNRFTFCPKHDPVARWVRANEARSGQENDAGGLACPQQRLHVGFRVDDAARRRVQRCDGVDVRLPLLDETRVDHF
jgi:hypothetical protein